MTTEPLRPTILETFFYEPDQRAVIAVLPGTLWLAPGDIVELDDPPRDARVLSARLQLQGDTARVLIVLDVPTSPDDALRGDTPTEVVLGADLEPPTDDLDVELERLTDEVQAEVTPTRSDAGRTVEVRILVARATRIRTKSVRAPGTPGCRAGAGCRRGRPACRTARGPGRPA